MLALGAMDCFSVHPASFSSILMNQLLMNEWFLTLMKKKKR